MGFAVAEECLREKAELVVISSSNPDKVNQAVARLTESNLGPGKAIGRPADAKDEAAIIALLNEVGEMDHIAWTSGDKVGAFFPNFELKDAKSFFDVRFWGPVIVAKNAKFRTGGSLVLTSASTVIKPVQSMSLSTCTAGAVETLCRGLAVDLAPIRVNTVRAGVIDTELWQESRPEVKEYTFNLVKNTSPVKHVGKPEEVAEAFIFLMK